MNRYYLLVITIIIFVDGLFLWMFIGKFLLSIKKLDVVIPFYIDRDSIMSILSDKIIFREALSDKKKKLVFSVNSLFNVPDSGVYVLFDDADYPNGRWRAKASFLNIKLGGIEEMSPSHLLEIMENDDCQYFIWISKRVCDSDEVTFTWVYSHEIQHLRQQIDFPELCGAGDFLKEVFKKIKIEEPRIETTIPTEYDADRFAKYVVTQIFDSSICERHIEMEIKKGSKPECFKVIKKVDLTKPYDVVVETINIILKYREQIQKLQLSSPEYNLIREFDIEALISHYKQ